VDPEHGWTAHLRSGWDGAEVEETLARVRGLRPQPDDARTEVKLSYTADDAAATAERVRTVLREAGLKASVVASRGTLIDVLPPRASQGQGDPLARADLGRPGRAHRRRGRLGQRPGDAHRPVPRDRRRQPRPELGDLRDRRGVRFVEGRHAAGVREGLRPGGWLSED
jgi:hypothetical protein